MAPALVDETSAHAVRQVSLNNDWLPLRADMREVAEAYGFQTRERDGALEVRCLHFDPLQL